MAEKNSLWKNIRKKAEQNRRTGATPKKPTAEMLRQERKIKAKQYPNGGKLGNNSAAERDATSTRVTPAISNSGKESTPSSYDTQALQVALDLGQMFPNPYVSGASYVASLPFTTMDVFNSLDKGEYKQAAIDALGYIPTFKAFKYGLKGDKYLDVTSKLAKKYKKINNVVNTVNLSNDASKKATGGSLYPDGGKLPSTSLLRNNYNQSSQSLLRLPNTKNNIDLHLQPYTNNEENKFNVYPYFNVFNPEPDVNVYYGGVDADLNLLNKNQNKLNISGGLGTGAATFPGGSEYFGVQPSAGFTFTRNFAKGGKYLTVDGEHHRVYRNADGGYMYAKGGKKDKPLPQYTYANKEGVVGGPFKTPTGQWQLPVSEEGVPLVNLPEVNIEGTNLFSEANPYSPITVNEYLTSDFNPINLLLPGPAQGKVIRDEKGNIIGETALEPSYPEMALLPGNLPFKGTTKLGKAAVGIAEAVNPLSGLGKNISPNELPLPPSEIQFMPDGTTRTVYNQQPITDYLPINGHAPGTVEWLRLNKIIQNYKQKNFKSKPTNKSGLTKEEVLATLPDKDKDVISKMSEEEFESTVLKPTGEIVEYKEAPLVDKISISKKEYVDAFNERLDLLNDIIAKRNKTGVEYQVKGLTEDGELIFYSPNLPVTNKLNAVQKQNINSFRRDPKSFLINKVGLRREGDKWILPDRFGGKTFNNIEEAIEFGKRELNDTKDNVSLNEVSPNSGLSTWGVRIKPGQWKGEVEDIANTDYFRNIPGLEMRNTSQSVFADKIPRKGSGAYESINEYLKKLDLGRVKPGFNSQTQHSKSAWENFIKSGRGVGFYGDPKTVYGIMKSQGGYMNPYMYYAGGPIDYKVGGKVWKDIGAGLYGIAEGILDTVTFGATDKLTDKGFNALQKMASKNFDPNDPEDVKWAKTQQQVKGYSNTAAAAATGVVTGNVGAAVAQGSKGLNTAFQASDWASDDFKKFSNIGASVGQLGNFFGNPASAAASGASGAASGATSAASTAASSIGKGSQIAGQLGKFGKQAAQASKYVGMGMDMTGMGQGKSLYEQGVARQDYLNSPEYKQQQELNQLAYLNQSRNPNYGVNQNVRFQDGGNTYNTNETNNSLNLQNNMFKNKILKRYKKGGILEGHGLSKVPSEVGYHYQHPEGGMPYGEDEQYASGGKLNASLEKNELIEFAQGGVTGLQNPEYIHPADVDGTNSINMPQMTSDYKMITGKDGLPKFSGKSPAKWLEEKLTQGSKLREHVDAYNMPTGEQVKELARGGREVAVAVNDMQKQQAMQDAMMIAEADNVAAYGGKLYKNLNMPGYSNGGKLPKEILRARVESHMSPEEANSYVENYAKGGGIHIKESKKGTFTAAAKKHGKGVQEFARQVLANKGNYSSAMVKKANFARNAAKWKHAEGGSTWVPPDEELLNMGYSPYQVEAIKLADQQSPVFESQDAYNLIAQKANLAKKRNDPRGEAIYGGMKQKSLDDALMRGLPIQELLNVQSQEPVDSNEYLNQMLEEEKRRPMERYDAKWQDLVRLRGEMKKKAQGGFMYGDPYAAGGNYGGVGEIPGDPNSVFNYSPYGDQYADGGPTKPYSVVNNVTDSYSSQNNDNYTSNFKDASFIQNFPEVSPSFNSYMLTSNQVTGGNPKTDQFFYSTDMYPDYQTFSDNQYNIQKANTSDGYNTLRNKMSEMSNMLGNIPEGPGYADGGMFNQGLINRGPEGSFFNQGLLSSFEEGGPTYIHPDNAIMSNNMMIEGPGNKVYYAGGGRTAYGIEDNPGGFLYPQQPLQFQTDPNQPTTNLDLSGTLTNLTGGNKEISLPEQGITPKHWNWFPNTKDSNKKLPPDEPWYKEPWYSKAARYGQAIPGAAASIYAFTNLAKRKLPYRKLTAEQVSYEPERISDRDKSGTGFSTFADRIRNAANNAGMFVNNLRQGLLQSNKDLAGRIAESVMREQNTNAQLRQQTGMAQFGADRETDALNEQMYQNAMTYGFKGAQDATDKLANAATEERQRYLQEWIFRNRMNTRSYKTNIGGKDVYKGRDGNFYDEEGNLVSV